MVDILETAIAKDLDNRVLDQDADVYIIRYNDGVVISKSPNASGDVFAQLDEFDDIKTNFNFDRGIIYEDDGYLQDENNDGSSIAYTAPLSCGGILTASPVPLPPSTMEDDRDYRPDVYVVQKISADVFKVVYEMEASIDDDVRKNILLAVFLGLFGFAVVMLILAVMSRVITKPLNWITEVARRVINKDFNGGEGDGARSENEEGLREEVGNSSMNTLMGFDDNHNNNTKCAPRTEIRQLVVEFQRMIQNFSGDGASKVAEPALFQIKNDVTWHSDFAMLYFRDGPLKKSFRQVSVSTEPSQLTEASRGLNEWPMDDSEELPKGEDTNGGKSASPKTESPPVIVMDDSEDQPSILSTGFDGNDLGHNSEPEDIISNRETDFDQNLIRIHDQGQVQSSGGSGDEDPGVFFEQGSESSPQSNKYNNDLDQRGANPEERLGQAADLDDAQVDGSEPLAPVMLDSAQMSANQDVAPEGSRRISFAPLPRRNPSGSGFSVIPAPVKVNRAPVLGAPKSMAKPMLKEAEGTTNQAFDVCRSALFWWIVLLMALPVFLTNTIIAAVATTSISDTIPAWVGSTESASSSIETDGLRFLADRKARVLSALAQGTFRDVHFMTRITGWLVFGGIQRSGTLTDVDTATEECKAYPVYECPFRTVERMPCPCNWECLRENKTAYPCTSNQNFSDSRYLQRQNFAVQKLDSDPATGNRTSSPSFPEFSYSPNTTSWWQNVSSLPGSEEGSASASGYKTLYDRVAVSSSASIFNFPVYNYATGLGKEKTFLGGFLSFEDDGLFFGWGGCYYSHSFMSTFQSSDENGAFVIDPILCPEGKFGYDPRCRSWYATGRETYFSDEAPVHVTAPYKFASNPELEQAASITSPIANPRTGEYAGQVLLDYITVGLGNSVGTLREPVSFLITPDEDVLGGDTVVGPNKSMEWKSAPIGDHLFVHEADSSNRNYFEREILPLMKTGKTGQVEFNRTTADGSNECIWLSFAPVTGRSLLAVAPDDFSAGVKVSESLVYSIGVGRQCEVIKQAFHTVEGDIDEALNGTRTVYLAINLTATVLFVVFSAVAAAYTTRPMLTLLKIVSNTNKGESGDSIPPLQGGCKEVQGVYNTFAKLNKIVRVSNTAFFSGNLEMAHYFVKDALSLYRKVNDQKAIGVACNNLANTLFAMRYEQMDAADCCEDCTEKCTISETLPLYDEAVERGRRDFDETPEGDLKVDYAIQLGDRLFNRGLYLLFIDGYDCAPQDARERGYRDVTVARNLHYDVRDYLLKNKQLFSASSSYFSRLLRRINCLAAFFDDIGLREIWDAEELLDEADQLVAAAWDSKIQCPLFRDVTKIGRRQQLESSAMLLAMHGGDHMQAARLGMRMLVEDMFILETSFVRAAEALVQVMKDGEVDFSRRTVSCARDDLRSMLRCCRSESLDIGKNVVLVLELHPQWADNPMLEELNSRCLALYDSSLNPDDNFGAVANNVKDTCAVELGTKEDNEGRQRTFIDVATTSFTSGSTEASFPTGLQMLIDSALSQQSDSFLILITDGCALDGADYSSFVSQIERLNIERTYQIHVLIIGLDVNDDEGRYIRILENLASVSKQSMVMNVKSGQLEPAFQAITTIVNGRSSHHFISFLTMEKF